MCQLHLNPIARKKIFIPFDPLRSKAFFCKCKRYVKLLVKGIFTQSSGFIDLGEKVYKFFITYVLESMRKCLSFITPFMDKLQLTGQNLVRVFNSRSDCTSAMHLFCYEAKQLYLKLKTRPKQLLGSLSSAFVLPALSLVKAVAFQ